MATEPLVVPVGCACADWDVQMPKINGPIILQSVRAGRNLFDGKPFVFCPWCGTRLPESPVTSSPSHTGD